MAQKELGPGSEGDAYRYTKKVLKSLPNASRVEHIYREIARNKGISSWTRACYEELRTQFFRDSQCKIKFAPGVARIAYGELEFGTGDEDFRQLADLRDFVRIISIAHFETFTRHLALDGKELSFKDLVERYFRIYAVTAEDRNKTQQYQANAMRKAQQARFADMDSYLRSLSMEIDIIPADDYNLPRIAQMTQKTNQFNLTTRRYTEAEICQRLNDGWRVYCMSVRDRFGDSGVTGAIFLEQIDWDTVGIDSLLLSCRVLGKGIEDAFVGTVLNLLHNEGVQKVVADYLPTAKNGQTAEFYDHMGMECIGTDDSSKHYVMTLDKAIEIKDYYNIKVL